MFQSDKANGEIITDFCLVASGLAVFLFGAISRFYCWLVSRCLFVRQRVHSARFILFSIGGVIVKVSTPLPLVRPLIRLAGRG